MENSIEEDIKNIEEMLEFKIDIIKYHAWVGTKVINSVENLLTRYKQLQKENEYLQYKLRKKISVEAHEQVKQNYIAKNIIKDKIEELEKKVEELTDEKGYWGGSDLLEQIKVLQVLLEKEK